MKSFLKKIVKVMFKDPNEVYLNSATDIVDLEYRIRAIEYAHYGL